MKKTLLFLISSLTIFLFISPSYAEHQRLGISPQPTIYLTAEKSSVEVEAFCLDRHKIIDGEYIYNYVLTSDSKTIVIAGERRLSLQQAIDEQIIRILGRSGRGKVFGSRIGLVFFGLKDFPITIEIQDSLAMGESAGKFNNSSILEILKKPKPNLESGSEVKQDEIWEADIDRSRLESLGYNSVEEFQKEKNLSQTGIFDSLTKTTLKEEEAALVERFEAVGLDSPRNDTKVKSVSDNIRKFQKQTLNEKIQAGIFSSDVRTRFEKYVEDDFPITKEVKKYTSTLDNTLVLIIKSETGQENLYKVYSQFRKEFEANKVSEINNFFSGIYPRFENVYLILDFPSQAKADAFKSSVEIARIKSRAIFFEGKSEARDVLFSDKTIFEIETVTKPVRKNKNYFTNTDLEATRSNEINKSWIITTVSKVKIKAISKLKTTVVKFTDAFKALIERKEKRSLANIVNEARKIDSKNKTKMEIRINYIDEFGEIHIVKIFFGKVVEVEAD
ncbi:MAG: hypothetical protein WA584_16370 [Pyrinomonadaceae bacterium]